MSAAMATAVRMILNTFYSGPQAWFFLADDLGYFADEGLTVTFTEGDTLANAVPRVASGDFDLGYGDLNALIEMAGRDPESAPVAIFVMHNRSPYTIAVAADGPVRTPRDLAGKRLLTHPGDAALRMLPEFAGATGLDATTLQITVDPTHHSRLLPLVLSGQADGLFGFVNTLASAAIEAGIAPGAFRHLEWRTHVPDLCGAAIIANRGFLATNQHAPAGFVRAVNRGLKATIDDPDAAIEAVRRRAPAIDIAANRARLMGTLAMEMAHPDGAHLGIGDVEPARLERAIALITRTKALPLVPVQNSIFDRAFLPPRDERERRLASLESRMPLDEQR
jgi:NitT/TauT family transport system substrate-binding protein